MRGLFKVSIFAVISAILIASAAFGTGLKTSVDITSVGMGARPIALGGAYVGIADDASAIFTNPGGLGLQRRLSFVSMSTQILTCVDYQLAAVSYPTLYGTFGVGYIGVTVPAGDFSTVTGGVTVEGGPMYYSNQMLILSYGCDISNFVGDSFNFDRGQVKNVGFGTNLKFLSQGFSGDISNAPSATGIEADLGIIYAPNDQLTLGATLQNIYRGSAGESLTWSTDEKENLPSMLKLGTSYRVIENVTLALDSDFTLNGEDQTVYHSGVEWQVIPLLTLRAGLDQKNASVENGKIGVVTDYTLGVGVTYSGFRFDYAYKQDPSFNEFSTHYFSFCYFGGIFERPVDTETNTLSKYEELIESNNKTAAQSTKE